MKVAWAVIAGALISVPILAVPARSPAEAEATVQPRPTGKAVAVVVDQGKDRPLALRIAL